MSRRFAIASLLLTFVLCIMSFFVGQRTERERLMPIIDEGLRLADECNHPPAMTDASRQGVARWLRARADEIERGGR